MVTRFDEFLNEYGGPGRAIGFRYSEPNIDYTFSIHTVINPDIGYEKIQKTIEDIFKKNNVGEESIEMIHKGGDTYELKIKIKGYSKYEILSMTNLLLNEVHKKVGKDVIFILDSIDLEGKDIEVKQNPIGFQYSKKDK